MLINKLSTSWLQWDLALPGKEGRTWIPFSFSPLPFFSCSFPASLPLFLMPFSLLQMFITAATSGPAFISEAIWVNEKNECREQTSYLCVPWDASAEMDLGPWRVDRVDSNSAQVARRRGSVWVLEGEEWAVPWDGNRGAHPSNERKVIGTCAELQWWGMARPCSFLLISTFSFVSSFFPFCCSLLKISCWWILTLSFWGQER